MMGPRVGKEREREWKRKEVKEKDGTATYYVGTGPTLSLVVCACR